MGQGPGHCECGALRQMIGQTPGREWGRLVRRQLLFWLRDSERSGLRIFPVDAFPLGTSYLCKGVGGGAGEDMLTCDV